MMKTPVLNLGNTKILQVLINNIKKSIKNKINEINKYSKSVKKMTTAFEQIKTAKGIIKISDIVESIIQSEDQYLGINKYLNEILAENDNLKAANYFFTKTISTKETSRIQKSAREQTFTQQYTDRMGKSD